MHYKPTVLLVDDDENILNSLWLVLRKKYNILTAQDGERAYEIVLKNSSILAIIADYIMPKKTGVELFISLRGKANIYKMLMTGHADVNMAMAAINKAKVSYFITKPFNCKDLCAILDREFLPTRLGTLTQRERQIVSLMTTGMSSKEVAHLLRISPVTMSVHKRNILKKLKMDKEKALVSALSSRLLGIF